MAKQKPRRRWESTEASVFDQARDEMFQHIISCGVIGSHPDDQTEWFDGTMQYLADRWHELTPVQLKELRTLGERFAQPPKKAAPSEGAEPADAASAA